jgi:hypothetical protein
LVVALALTVNTGGLLLACVGLGCGGEGDGAGPQDERSPAAVACVETDGDPEPGQVPTVQLT